MNYSRRQLEAFGEPLGDSATRVKPGSKDRIYGGGGGGGTPQPSSQTVYQTSIPEYARPYVEGMLGRAEALTDTGYNPYQQYMGERFAQFSPLQMQAFQGASSFGPSADLGAGAGLAGQAGAKAMNVSYDPGTYTSQFQAPAAYVPGQITPREVAAQQGIAPLMRAAQTNYRPDLVANQMGPAAQVAAGTVSSQDMQAAQTGYRPDLRQYQMGPAERVSTQTFVQPGTAQQFMSPYMQQVVEQQQIDAQRQADIANQALKAQFAQSGAYGGGRFAVQQAQAAQALARQKGDIQATGLQAAYQQAQQQFNAEQQARLAAQQANQQAGLTVGAQNLGARLGVQQLQTQAGLQTALANLNAQQQAAVQNQAARLQASGMSAQMALQAALANQQAGLTVGAQNLAAQQQTQQLQTQAGLQTALANLSASQQAAVQNQAAQLQMQGMNQQQALQAALANQQAGLQAQQLGEQSRQFGAGLGMQGASMAAQYGQAANQLTEQSRQFGAGLGLQGLQTAMQGAGTMVNAGQAAGQQQLGALNLQAQLGALQQQQAQNILNAQYQDFLNFQNHPYKQLGFMSDMLRGLPMSQSTATMYQAPMPMGQQLAGLGLAAYGMSRMAQGGRVQSRSAGLADLALARIGA